MSIDPPHRSAPAQIRGLVDLADSLRHPRPLVAPTSEETAALVRKGATLPWYAIAGGWCVGYGFLMAIMAHVHHGPPRALGWVSVVLGFGLLVIVRVRREERQLRLARRLRTELPVRSYPVVGYVAWRFAARPALDIELRGPIDHELLRDAALAIDRELEIAWPQDDIVRIGMKMPDRAKLQTLLDRLVAPIEHEVGVERIVMGNAGGSSPG
jgi:hypothetical protein